ncbi:hypothetical protein [Mycobacteroides abscessus]|uniref:hypothetical protein n=1 Tax=Mycobacteroides abscessus TaxID=36809 RepID=UPI0009A87E2B|nr:hypothetical protein [Mycobacteroides abscessus]SLH41885.1 Uncharacterised protein [Mycobacteroides abscessus subsp. massiliense]
MEATSFRNHPRFAYSIKFLREALEMDIAEIDSEGGPARSYVTDIERVDDMPITDATIGKYIAAFKKAKSRTQYSANDSSLESFIRSYATIFKALEDADGTRERSKFLADERQWDTAKQSLAGRRIFIGIDLLKEDALFCDVLTAPPAKSDDGQRSLPAALTAFEHPGEAERMLLKIAGDQPALTLIPKAAVAADNALYAASMGWSLRGGDTFTYGVTGRGWARAVIDPIAAVFNLDGALERAEILGAVGTDVVSLAWAILLANAASARGLRSPIELLDHEIPSIDQLGAEFTGTMPASEQIQLAIEKYLLPWALQHTAATWDVRFEVPSGAEFSADSASQGEQLDGVGWKATRTHHPDGRSTTVTGYSVCIYDHDQFPQLARVLEALNKGAITYTPGRLAGDEQRAQTWELCMVGPHEAFGVVRAAGTDEWRPVQLYAVATREHPQP